MSVLIDYEAETEEEEGDETDIPRPAVERNRQVKKRRRFTLLEKMASVRTIQRNIEGRSLSVREACRQANLHHKQFITWKRDILQMQAIRNKKAKSMCLGPSSTLHAYEDELLRYIFELRECGMAVSSKLVIIKAASLSRAFREKDALSQYHCVRRFVIWHGLVHQMGTHVSQRDPRELQVVAEEFMQLVCPMISGLSRDQDHIINMDQSPIPFTFDRQRTLELVGSRTVHIRKSTCDTKRATLAITITASGKKLTPILVFKGEPRGEMEHGILLHIYVVVCMYVRNLLGWMRWSCCSG